MIILLSIFFFIFFAYISLIIYYRFIFVGIKEYVPSLKEFSTKISIIIPARNEEKNIEKCLTSMLKNNYPTHLLQIIVVDDFSDDDTANLVLNYTQQKVELIKLNENITEKINSYKKKAIEIAIEKATGTLIITTDADCIVPNNWLHTLVSYYEEHHPVFMAAPVQINANNTAIQIFQALDFMTLQGITAAVVFKNQMTMCNGANMAYERKVFYEVGGFDGIDNIASGDDMLLMHKIFNKYPSKIAFIKSKNAIVKTAAVDSLKAFFSQRIRWASKAEKYDDKRILPVLVLVYFFNVMMLVLPIIAMITNFKFELFSYKISLFKCWSFMLIAKTIVELFFLYPIASFFNNRYLLWLFPLCQLPHICYNIIAGWLGKFGKYVWKERMVK